MSKESNMIIWLASYPRSGNTYFRVLLKHYFNIDTFSVYDETIPIGKEFIKDLVGVGEQTTPVDEKIRSNNTSIIKTHDLPQDDYSAIYIVRDGRDALVSYAHYILSRDINDKGGFINKFNLILNELVETDNYFGGWGDHTLSWMQRASNTVVIKFEELVQTQDPYTIVSNALKKVEYPVTLRDESATIPSFDDLHNLWPAFFRKGKIGAWKTEMLEETQDLFWKRYDKAMEVAGYQR